MSGKINLLSEDTIGKIAAGEVVERPASVVKELVENSIDAGADSVEVEIDRSGQNLIRVADNGSGMELDDAVLAFKRHATSKIKKIEDLEKILTLGFRGEALASIASVSQVDVNTKRDQDQAGVYMYIESGVVQRSRPAPRDTGTTIEVRNLFYNVPARRKFLKRESTEMSEIVGVFSRFVLSHPEVGFKLVHGGRCLLDAPIGLDIKGRIGLVFGEDVPGEMMAVQYSEGAVSVKGFVSVPSFTRKDKKGQIFFVNGRVVRSKVLSEALYVSYRSLLERGRYPWGVLFVAIPPDRIDVNVHPAKLEIKFDDEKAVKHVITRAVEQGFEKIRSIHAHGVHAEKDSKTVLMSGMAHADEEDQVLRQTSGDQGEFKYEAEPERPVKQGRESLCAPSPVFASDGQFGGRMFQLGDSYIVRVMDEGMIITDQHAAHERVLYEFFSKTLNGACLEKQGLLFPLRVDLTAEEFAVMQQIMPGLLLLGFEIESFGERSFIVRSAPAVIKPRFMETVIKDIISDLVETGTGNIEYMEELVKLVSCRSAIKAGDVLSREEMEELLIQLEKCDLPFTCPHGRPTNVEISLKELEKRFRRL